MAHDLISGQAPVRNSVTPFPRIAAYSGLVAFVLYVVAIALQGVPPAANASVADVSAYVGADQGTHQAASVVWVLHGILGMVLLVGIYGRLRSHDPSEQKEWSVVFLVGAVLVGALTTLLTIAYGVLYYRGGGFGEDVVQMLWDTGSVTFATVGGAVAIASGVAAVGSLRWSAFPRWYGWSSAVVAVVGLLGIVDSAAPSLSGGLLAMILGIALGLWILASSVALLRMPSRM